MTDALLGEDNLLEGAFHALSHAGALIRDAVLLLGAGRFSSALVLAVFALEEVGRHRIYLQESARLPSGGTVKLTDLEAKTHPHVEKIRRSDTETRVTLPKDLAEQLAEVSRRPSQPETKEVLAKIRRHARRQHRHDPDALHERRKRALYVQPLEKGLWSLPSATTEEEARRVIGDALTHYANTVADFRDAAQFSAAIARLDLQRFEDPKGLSAALSQPHA